MGENKYWGHGFGVPNGSYSHDKTIKTILSPLPEVLCYQETPPLTKYLILKNVVMDIPKIAEVRKHYFISDQTGFKSTPSHNKWFNSPKSLLSLSQHTELAHLSMWVKAKQGYMFQ